jgi:hypothetical protein
MRTLVLSGALLIALAPLGCQQGRKPAGQAAVPTGRASPSGWEIRYNATVALARHGSDKIKDRIEVLDEMLDENQQLANCRTTTKDGQEVTDLQAATGTVTNALKAIAELHRRRPEMDLSSLNPAIDKLTQSSNAALRTEAERTRVALGRS